MLIKSYLAFPHKGQKEILHSKLNELEWCEVIPAENENVLVIVTESSSIEEEETRLNILKEIKELDHFSMVSGFNENSNIKKP